MLGIHLMGDAPFEVVYLSGLVRDPYGQKMSKTKGNVVDPLEAIDESGADALRFALIHGAAPGQRPEVQRREARERAQLRQQALERGAVRARGAAGDRSRPALPRVVAGPGPTSGRPSAGCAAGSAATVAAADRALADFAFGELTAHALRLDLGRVLRLGAGARQGPPGGRVAPGGRPRGHVVDARRGARHVPPPAPPGHAVRDRGDLGAAAARRRRPGAPDRRRLAGSPARSTRRPRPRSAALLDLVRAIRNARSEAKVDPGLARRSTWPCRRRSRPTFEALRPALERLARARPLRARGRSGGAALGTGGGLAVVAGDLEAVIRPAAADGGAAARDRARLEKELADAETQLAAARARLADERFTSRGAGRRRRGRPRPRGGARRAGGAAPRPPGRLTRGAGADRAIVHGVAGRLVDGSASATAWRDRPLVGLPSIDPREVPCRSSS